MNRNSLLAHMVGALALIAAPALGQTITYQGQLKQNGALLNGPQNMAFTLWDDATGGNQIGTTIKQFSLPVVDGVFTAQLEFGTDVFNQHPRYLQVQIGNEVLSPRQPVTPAPVALFALDTLPMPSPWTQSGTYVYNVGVNVGIGTLTPGALLDISNSQGAERIRFSGRGRASNLTSPEGVSLLLGPNDSSSNRQLWVGVSDALSSNTSNGVLRLMPGGSAGTGTIDAISTNGFWPQNLVLQSGGGNVGIGTGAPAEKLSVAGVIESTTGGFKFPDGSLLESAFWQSDGANISYNDGNVGIGTSSPAFPLSLGSSLGQKLALYQNNVGGDFYGFGIAPGVLTVSAAGAERMRIDNSGRVGIGTTSPQGTLHVAGSLYASDVFLVTVSAVAGSFSNSLTVNGPVTMREAVITGGGDIAEPFNVNGEGTGNGEQGAGEHRPLAIVEPGMVVCIDAANPGELRLSTRAYDRTVAGIISGAGGVKPGMTLRQEGSVADGEHPVALTGRVYAYVDADAGGPVQPGDLLTTSDTPGHAMKAADFDQAHGATIGKAMTELKSGKGLVLVLVSLN